MPQNKTTFSSILFTLIVFLVIDILQKRKIEKSCSQEASMNTAFVRSIKENPHLPNDEQSCAVSCSSHISADV